MSADSLLQLVAHLQHTENPTYGRNTLLKYIRKQSGAQLVVLFLLNKEQQVLQPLASNGNSFSLSAYSLKQLLKKPVSVAGLFGSALLTQGLLYISNIANDSRILTEERPWMYPDGRILLNAIRVGDAPDSEQGILLLSFVPGGKDAAEDIFLAFSEEDLKICSIFLSTYLAKHVKSQSIHRPRRTNKHRYVETVEPLQKPSPQEITLPEVTYSLSALSDLYELGLVATTSTDVQSLYQHILSHLARITQAHFASLLLYHPSLCTLLPVAQIGEGLSSSTLLDAIDELEMKRLIMCGPEEIVSSVSIDGQRILLVTLSYNCNLLGIITLAASDYRPDEHGFLLNYMGNVTALILRNSTIHIQEQQAAIEHERSRIARDIHDGAAQQIAHALHKMEFIQRLLERQPVVSPFSHTALMEIENAYHLLQASLKELRQSISSLLPLQLEEQNFSVALHTLLDEYMLNDPGLTITCDTADVLPATLEAPLFRFIQEALTNVHKHAQATRVSISISISSNILVVEVCDNGIGFYLEASKIVTVGRSVDAQHIGLRAMHERIQEAGGNLDIESSPGEGTILRARFTLENSAQLLTPREHEVLRLIIAGQTNRAIAQKLSISLETAKSHVRHIMQKMQVKDRTQAAVLATRQGWV